MTIGGETMAKTGAQLSDSRSMAAHLATSPEYSAWWVLLASEYETFTKQTDGMAAIAVLREQAAAVSAGDLTRVEAMLINQATALQSLFSTLTKNAMTQKQIPNFEAYLRLALKAQSQCRTTLEALAAIKNPRPVAFVRQSNIAHGPQQVNNAVATPSRAREIQNENPPTKLSEGDHELLPDTRAPSVASRVNPPLEAVGALHRPKDAEG